MTAHPHAVPPGLAVGAALGLVPLGQQRNSVHIEEDFARCRPSHLTMPRTFREVENGLLSIRAIYFVTPRAFLARSLSE